VCLDLKVGRESIKACSKETSEPDIGAIIQNIDEVLLSIRSGCGKRATNVNMEEL